VNCGAKIKQSLLANKDLVMLLLSGKNSDLVISTQREKSSFNIKNRNHSHLKKIPPIVGMTKRICFFYRVKISAPVLFVILNLFQDRPLKPVINFHEGCRNKFCMIILCLFYHPKLLLFKFIVDHLFYFRTRGKVMRNTVHLLFSQLVASRSCTLHNQ